MSLDLFQTGTLLRCPGGQVQTVSHQVAAGMKWAAMNIGTDSCVIGNRAVWDTQRADYRAAGVPLGPWRHCRSMEDIADLIAVGVDWKADFIGCNIEDVVKDNLSLREVGGYLLDFWVNAYDKPVHMPTLPWVQNEQNWQYVNFCYLALEMFPLEGQGQTYLDQYEACIDHAFKEGAKRVTLLYSTTSPRNVYPNVAHCLYVADNILAADWPSWKDSVPQVIPTPPNPEVPPVASNVPYPRPLILGDQGIDVEGLGRALCKTGFYVPLTQFSKSGQQWRRTYGGGKRDAINALRKQAGYAMTGQYNLAVHDLMEKRGYFDAKAIDLISRYEPPPPPAPVRIRAAMTDFCLRAEAHESVWHYTQNRPFSGYGNDPESTHYGDCSAYCSLVYFWAKQETGLNIPDPTRYNYSGYGNTGDDLDGHPRVSAPYQIGDLAHYEGHVSICRKPGSASVAVFSSFGKEAGPNETKLNYRNDLRFVCRPPFS